MTSLSASRVAMRALAMPAQRATAVMAASSQGWLSVARTAGAAERASSGAKRRIPVVTMEKVFHKFSWMPIVDWSLTFEPLWSISVLQHEFNPSSRPSNERYWGLPG
ncbi:hypothetical protein MK974_23535 [Burkholderia ambifaria]|uniref:hypothetical protein n=1 Tax=Burkholderia ambifaria TaxID=152480 RepID=UPI0022A9037F|nr:hypothetical protein [Burkholderia ambifaria]WAS58200.1 hypothetical protein MK974_23535 [Burkholderia ambifaria]